MAKSRELKSKTIDELEKGFDESKSVVFTNFSGLNVKEQEDLRKKLRTAGISFIVAKKKLLRIVLGKRKIELPGIDEVEGNYATAFCKGDEVAPSKVLAEFSKSSEEKLMIQCGMLEGKLIDKQKVMELSILPSKQELLVKVVGTINAPVSGFVNVLRGNISNLINVLNAVKEFKN